MNLLYKAEKPSVYKSTKPTVFIDRSAQQMKIYTAINQ